MVNGLLGISSQRNKAARRVNDTRFPAPLIIHFFPFVPLCGKSGASAFSSGEVPTDALSQDEPYPRAPLNGASV